MVPLNLITIMPGVGTDRHYSQTHDVCEHNCYCIRAKNGPEPHDFGSNVIAVVFTNVMRLRVLEYRCALDG